MAVVENAARLAQAGSWVLAATRGSTTVRSLVPDIFGDYARIFHPAMRKADERDLPLRAAGESNIGVHVSTSASNVPWREVRWREIAEANGKVAHPGMQWDAIAGSHDSRHGATQPGLWERAPQRDSLPLRVTRVLCEILAEFTGTAGHCWCGVWEGYEYMIGVRSDSTLPRLALWNRPMIVGCGPLSAVPEKSFTDGFADLSGRDNGWQSAELYRSPSLWWPDDRAWCVATDVEMCETYVGASPACVDRLIADDRVEVMRVTADQDITYNSDAINLLPPHRTTTQ